MKNIRLEELDRCPNCQLLSPVKFPVQPYREFMYFCSEHFYDNLGENKTDKSFRDILNDIQNAEDKQKAYEGIAAYIRRVIPDAEIKFNSETMHRRIFMDFNVLVKGETVCNVVFYTHMSFISTQNIGDKLFVACQFDFSMFDGFDFLELDRDNNLFDFCKDDEDTGTFDMVISCIAGLVNFTDFIKTYKTKKIVANNIETFVKKLIAPNVTDYQVLFGIHEFIVSVLCGDSIEKKKYTYDNYLASVKEFAAEIEDAYGDRYRKKGNSEEDNGAEDASTVR